MSDRLTEELTIPLGTDFEVDIDVMAMDQGTGEVAAVVGETLVFFFSATKGGAAIHADLSIILTDIGDGRYYGVVPGYALTAQLADYVGQQIYPRLHCPETSFDGVFANGCYRVTEVAEVGA